MFCTETEPVTESPFAAWVGTTENPESVMSVAPWVCATEAVAAPRKSAMNTRDAVAK